MTYAKKTSVPIEKTKTTIERDLAKHGASRFGYMTSDDEATIVFAMGSRSVKFVLPMPARNSERFNTRKGSRSLIRLTKAAGDRAWVQEMRSRWRVLSLVIRAKLEAIEAGVTTFESEFLAHIVTSDGMTVGEKIIPQLAGAFGSKPSFQLGAGR